MKMAVLENVIHKVKITLNGSQAVLCPISVPLGVNPDIQFIAVQLSGTAYPVILSRLHHLIKLSNYFISILGKLETRHSWKTGQVFFRF